MLKNLLAPKNKAGYFLCEEMALEEGYLDATGSAGTS